MSGSARNGEEWLRAYEAFLVLREARLRPKEIYEAIRELVERGLLEADVPSYSTIRRWYRGEGAPKVGTSPLIKAVLYHEAYELAIELRRERPDWGHTRIAAEACRRLGVRVPKLTVYFWITGRSKPNVTPLKIRPELALLLGYLVERGLGKGEKIEFVTKYGEIAGIAEACGIEVKEAGGVYRVRGEHSALRYLLRKGLWRCLEAAWPEEFKEGRELGERERKSRRVRREVNPGSLAFEAVLLCRGLTLDETVVLLNKAKEYGLQIELPGKGMIERWLSGDVPDWYDPSPLYLALEGEGRRKPIRVCPELAELLGEGVAEVGRGGKFDSTEYEHAAKVARLMTEVTGTRHEPSKRRDQLKWRVGWSTALDYLLRTGLYKVVALRWPGEFSKGLFDGDGSLYAWVDSNGWLCFELRVTLEKDEDLVEFTKRLLEEELGIKMRIAKRNDNCVNLCCSNSVTAIRKFAKNIGFGLRRKQRRLERLLRLLELKGKSRAREFLRIKDEWLEDYRPRRLPG